MRTNSKGRALWCPRAACPDLDQVVDRHRLGRRAGWRAGRSARRAGGGSRPCRRCRRCRSLMPAPRTLSRVSRRSCRVWVVITWPWGRARCRGCGCSNRGRRRRGCSAWPSLSMPRVTQVCRPSAFTSRTISSTGEVLVLRPTPGSAHAEAAGAAGLGRALASTCRPGAGAGGRDRCRGGRLRAVAAVLRAAAGLDREQGGTLHFRGRSGCDAPAGRGRRARAGQLEQRLDLGDRPLVAGRGAAGRRSLRKSLSCNAFRAVITNYEARMFFHRWKSCQIHCIPRVLFNHAMDVLAPQDCFVCGADERRRGRLHRLRRRAAAAPFSTACPQCGLPGLDGGRCGLPAQRAGLRCHARGVRFRLPRSTR